MQRQPLAALVAPLAIVLAMASACSSSDNGSAAGSTDTAATGDSAVAADVLSGQDGAADTGGGSDVAPLDAAADGGEQCSGGLPACKDPKTGGDDPALCPKPIADYACVAGCCTKKFKCSGDQDCLDKLGKIGFGCSDDRFNCACDLETGACHQTWCSTDIECPSGTICAAGGCKAAPDLATLKVVFLNPKWVAVPGQEVVAGEQLGAQAVDAKGVVRTDVELEWKLEGASFTLTDAKLKATDAGGEGTIEAQVKGVAQSLSAPAKLWNLGVVNKATKLRLAAIEEGTIAPVAGVFYVAASADATPTLIDAPKGVVELADVSFPTDIHFFAEGHQYVSIMGYEPAAGGGVAEVMLPAARTMYAKLSVDKEDTLVVKDSEFDGADVVKGKVNYPGTNADGEAALGVTSVAFNQSLFNFNLDLIIGPNVKRYFDKDAPTFFDNSKPSTIPGGLCFALGKPLLSTWWLAATPGPKLLWTLGGRLPLDVVLEKFGDLADQLQGGSDIDFGKIVSILFPFFKQFNSAITKDVPFLETLTTPTLHVDVNPNYPLGLRATVAVPELPKLDDGQWADIAVMVVGAMLPDQSLVPLGLNAGVDKPNKEFVADGKADSDPNTPEIDPYEVGVAPLHSGTRMGAANYAVALVAATIGDNGKKEAGSAIMSDVGALQKAPYFDKAAFLPFANGSAWANAERKVTVKAVAGAHFYRVIFKAQKGHEWHVYLAKPVNGLTLPNPNAWSASIDDRAKDPKDVVVNAFELRAATDLATALRPFVLGETVTRTRRTSFINVY